MMKEYLANILYFDEIPSTQQYLIDTIDTYYHGQVVVAKKQTHGRGRMQRTWLSDNHDNIYMSILLKPSSCNISDLPLPNLTQLMSLSICNFLTSTIPDHQQLKPSIKWPNDVLLNGKKISGILSQAVFDQEVFKGVVLGVGFNVTLNDNEILTIDQPATGLKNEIDVNLKKEEIALNILKDFFNKYNPFLEKGFSYIKDSYLEFFPFIGREIEILAANRTEHVMNGTELHNSRHNVTGKVKDLSNEGTLVIEDDNGKNINISMGDMQCL